MVVGASAKARSPSFSTATVRQVSVDVDPVAEGEEARKSPPGVAS
jgi:hypothetical protein